MLLYFNSGCEIWTHKTFDARDAMPGGGKLLLETPPMPHDIALIIGPDGSHIQSVNIVDCADDQAALDVAKQLLADEHDVEVWQEGRKLTCGA